MGNAVILYMVQDHSYVILRSIFYLYKNLTYRSTYTTERIVLRIMTYDQKNSELSISNYIV